MVELKSYMFTSKDLDEGFVIVGEVGGDYKVVVSTDSVVKEGDIWCTEDSLVESIKSVECFYDIKEVQVEQEAPKEGGFHCNVNVLNREDLLEAQLHPEKFPQLCVRVSGYSIFWNKLTKEQQDDVISRTFHNKI